MEKIILAIDALKLDINALDFACYIGRLTKSKITGAFLENYETAERPLLNQMLVMNSIDIPPEEASVGREARQELIEKNILFFKESCISKGINFSLHRDRGNPATELAEESRYADLLIASAGISFHKPSEGSLTEFVREVLKNAECPVIIAPEKFEAVDQVIFTYDGTASSVFAIKQFTYLFPQLGDKKVTIIQVNDEGKWRDPDKYKFKEWLKAHYIDMHFEALKGETDTELFSYLLKRENIFIVMGAYGRNSISRFFKHSHADLLIKTVTQPIFITHL